MKKLAIKLLITLVVLSGVPALASAKTNSSNLLMENPLPGYGRYTVPAFSRQTHRVWIERGYSEVIVSGDGDTDLDLYIYDGYGRQITRQNNYGDDEYAAFTVNKSGYFTVVVENLGRFYNNYELAFR